MLDFLDDDKEMTTSVIPVDGHRSVKKLRELGFDPLEAQVKLYKELVIEEAFVRSLRNGKVIHVDCEGKRVKYSAMYHTSLLTMIQKTAEAMTRYAYGRVPETVQNEDKPQEAFVIELTTEHYHNASN
jgi:hypothetical protein